MSAPTGAFPFLALFTENGQAVVIRCKGDKKEDVFVWAQQIERAAKKEGRNLVFRAVMQGSTSEGKQ